MNADVVNFRVLRGADRKIANESMWIELNDPDLRIAFRNVPQDTLNSLNQESGFGQILVGIGTLMNLPVEQRMTFVRQVLTTSELGAIGSREATLDPLLLKLDEWLVTKNNRPEGTEFEAKILELAKTVNLNVTQAQQFITRSEFLKTYGRLILTLMAGLNAIREPDLFPYEARQRVLRLLIVQSLVLRWFSDVKSVDESREIANFLRFARVKFPAEMLAAFRTQNSSVRRSGLIDHYIVREEWDRYELGELADVNSVMPGETRKRTHIRLTEDEEETQESRERLEVDEKNLQTENRYEFSEAIQEAQNLRLAAEGSVESTTMVGPNTTVVNVGGAFEFSSENSKDTATKHTNDVIERASNIVHQRTFKARSTRKLTRVTEKNEHSFQNTELGAKPINGLYRWIDRINRVSLWRYPQRYVIEFVLTEPGAWLRWALSKRGRDARLPAPPPEWPAWLNSANDIVYNPGQSRDYLAVAKLLGATDVPTKPDKQILGITLVQEPDEKDTWLETDNDEFKGIPVNYNAEGRIAVPDGCKAVKFVVTVSSRTRWKLAFNAFVVVIVGDAQTEFNFAAGLRSLKREGNLTGITTGQIPIHAAGYETFGFAVNVLIECIPTEEALVEWQQAVFDRFLQTHQRAVANYENAVEALQVAGELDDRTLSPGRVRELIQIELKRQVIATMNPTIPLQTMILDPDYGPYYADRGLLAQRAPQILFFEQAFEWSTLSWILYPYYWGAIGRWQESATTESANPEFDRFIQSGSARVVVAARPGFEEQVQFFLDYGAIWGGGGVPAPNESGYLSIAEEIMDLQRGPKDGEFVESWPVRLPTALTALDPTGSLPLIRPQPPTP